jgi:alkylhydroperoxidase family enzyme
VTTASSWLPDAAPGATDLERVFALRPDLYDPFRDFYSLFWTQRLLDPVVLELCRLRVAQLLGNDSEQRVRYRPALDAGLDEEQVARLPAWPSDPAFTDAQRAALTFTEQFVLDPHGIDAALRDQVADHVGVPGLVALCEALALFEGFCRFRTILGMPAPPTVTVVAGPTPDGALA